MLVKSEKWYQAIREANTTHGFSDKERLYTIWLRMRQRCNSPSDKGYPYYGGRGISVCEEWNTDYSSFRKWALAEGYTDSLTLDRIDNNCGYSPENCRWVDKKTQANNRRTNRIIEWNGEQHTLSEWAGITGIGWSTIRVRLEKGWSVEKALTTPVRRHKEYATRTPQLSNRLSAKNSQSV